MPGAPAPAGAGPPASGPNLKRAQTAPPGEMKAAAPGTGDGSVAVGMSLKERMAMMGGTGGHGGKGGMMIPGLPMGMGAIRGPDDNLTGSAAAPELEHATLDRVTLHRSPSSQKKKRPVSKKFTLDAALVPAIDLGAGE